MIDFRKELAKFDFITVDAEFAGSYNEAAQVIEVFNSTLKRIGMELNNTNMQLRKFCHSIWKKMRRTSISQK